MDICTLNPRDFSTSYISLLCSKQYPPKSLVTIFSKMSSIFVETLLPKSTEILLKLKVLRCFCCISCTSFKDSFCGTICSFSKYDENLLL